MEQVGIGLGIWLLWVLWGAIIFLVIRTIFKGVKHRKGPSQ